MRIVTAAAMLLLALAPFPARAEDPPGGFYVETCTGAAMTKNPQGIQVLTAFCRNYYGQAQESSLPAPLSCNFRTLNGKPWIDVANINGNLRCFLRDGHSDPSGHGNLDQIGKTVWTDATMTRTFWTIDQPTITQPSVDYPDIKYEPGDSVALTAGGCAQTGGMGNTWKSYLDPQPASDGKYYGEATLPGTGTPPSQRIAAIDGRRLQVFESGDKHLFLTLGYVDDGYGDNGYYSHDDGDDGQCSGSLPGSLNHGPAWVSLEVDHPLKAPAALPYSPGSQPFDIIYNQLDNNGLPMNPKWHAQRDTDAVPDFKATCGPAFSSPALSTSTSVEAGLAGAASGGLSLLFSGGLPGFIPTTMNASTLASVCTSQGVAIDQFSPSSTWGSLLLAAGPICPADPIRGHLNWWPVTYAGRLHFSAYSGSYPNDDDVNLILDTGSSDGLTGGSIEMQHDGFSETYPYGGFLLEFDASETIEPYLKSSWWKGFGTAAMANDRAKAEELLGGSYWAGDPGLIPPDQPANAVVTGLFGIDGVHDGGITEIHPVFSLAVHLGGDVLTAAGKTEHWAFFLRNQGDQGGCSAQTHTLEPEEPGGRDYYISLPWPDDYQPSPVSVSASIHATPWVSGAAVAQTEAAPGVGTFLHFRAPAYSPGDSVPFFGFDGDVTLQYTFPTASQPQKAARREPGKEKAPVHQAGASPAARPETDFDTEDFPWEKLIAAAQDPAVKTHLQKYFAQKPAARPASAPLPELTEASGVAVVAAKSPLHRDLFPRRTRALVNVATQRRSDELAAAAGSPRRSFAAIDAEHVLVLGSDGVLRLALGPFNAGSGDAARWAAGAKVVGQDVQAFDMVSADEILTLHGDGALAIERAPFNPPPSAGAAPAGKKTFPTPVSRFKALGDGNAMVLDAGGKLWSVEAPLTAAAKATQVAKDVRDFQAVDALHTLVLTSDDRLQSYPVAAGGAAPAVYVNVWSFQQAADGSLFVIDASDALWREQPRQQIDSDVRTAQALDAHTLFVLKVDGTLWLRRTTTAPAASEVKTLVASGARAFQALDAQTVWVLDEDGRLWLERGDFGPHAPSRVLVAANVR